METGRDFFQHKTVRRARDKGGLAIRLYKWEKVLDTILVLSDFGEFEDVRRLLVSAPRLI